MKSSELTPEQHIDRAELLLDYLPKEMQVWSGSPKTYLAISAAASAHAAIAEYKKKYPPENGRPVVARGPRMSDG